MKEFNFNTLRDLPVPESWIENALAIPEREAAKTAAVPFWKKPRTIATAASLLLVSALSVALFLSFGTGSPVKVKSSPSATEIVWSTDAFGETVATEVVIVSENPDSSTNDGEKQDHTLPTEPKSAITSVIDRIFGTDHTAPTTATGSDRSGRTSPATKNSPTENGKTSPTNKPDPSEGDRPTEQQAPVPTEPPTPPTERPTQVPQRPTEADWEPPTAVPWYPDYPTESPTESGGEQPTTAPPPIGKHSRKRLLYVSIPGESVPSDRSVYCKLLTEDGALLGEYDLCAEERRMTVLASGEKYTYYYVITDYIAIPDEAEGSTAVYYVYDSSGNIIVTGNYQL